MSTPLPPKLKQELLLTLLEIGNHLRKESTREVVNRALNDAQAPIAPEWMAGAVGIAWMRMAKPAALETSGKEPPQAGESSTFRGTRS